MGERRVGRPVLVDTHRPGAFHMAAFTGEDAPSNAVPGTCNLGAHPVPALRRFRQPVVADVAIEDGRPMRVRVAARADAASGGGAVITCAGPWRTSGEWWADTVWDHDEWDVGLDTGVVCRLFRDRRKDRWYVAGTYD
jgi:protein ImuB